MSHATSIFRTPRGLRHSGFLLACAAACLASTLALGAENSNTPGASAVLYLNNGFVRGLLRDSDRPEFLHWQGADFVAPFEFNTRLIDAVYFPDPMKPERPVGEYCFELSAGDVVFGSLVSLTDQEAELDVPLVGRLRVPRNHLQRLTRKLEDGGMIYRGPNGFSDWKLSSTSAWHNDQGQLWTDQNDSTAQSTLKLPSRCAVELVLSWGAKPNFAFALGMGYRIEAWQRELVLVGESEHQADLASLQPLDYEAGRIHLFLYLDQQTGECLVYSSKGAPLANMKLTDVRRAPLALRLSNNRGDIHLERLRIDHWNRGRPLAGEAIDKPRICLADGSIKYAQIASFDAAAKSFALRGADMPTIAVDRVVDVFLGKTDQTARALTVDYQDSSRLSGRLLKIENSHIWLASPASREPLRLPIAGLRSLIAHPGSAPVSKSESETTGILEMEGVRLPGKLTEGHEAADASCLVWRPRGSATSSALKADVNGRIIFREMAPPGRRPERRQVRRNPRRPDVISIESNAEESASHSGLTKAIYLRTGDMVPCDVVRIDSKGVSYKTPLADLGTIANDKIKAVVLTLDGRGPVELTKDKRDRLLTLPRAQRDNPPSHLIRSCDGDYLRARLVEMDDRKLTVEVRTEVKQLPRDRVSRIIWLHPDELEGGTATRKKIVTGPAPTVQAVHDNGTRLTFHPTQFKDSILSGVSDALGPCRIGLESIDQLLIGSMIEEAVTKTAYQQWKLRHAVDPKFVAAEANAARGIRSEGLDSALVGKPAPDFELEMLAGEKFHLTDHKGKIVVIDFWATWCGPCLQTIPHVAQLHHDAAATGIKVVAVNLEEAPEQIQKLLKRLKLDLPVALDRDGAIAARYGVSAIPQTIIIDREGKVVRHFVGGGAHFAKDLAEALQQALTGAAAASPKGASH
jgi:thiol-disulfide isomerase/thioredoxin